MNLNDPDHGITRKIIHSDDDFATIIETYDLTHPNCPMSVWRTVSMPWEKDTNANSVVRATFMSEAELARYIDG